MSLVGRSLAPLSYWLAWLYYQWARHPVLGRVDPLHPDAHKVGRRIYELERLLGLRR